MTKKQDIKKIIKRKIELTNDKKKVIIGKTHVDSYLEKKLRNEKSKPVKIGGKIKENMNPRLAHRIGRNINYYGKIDSKILKYERYMVQNLEILIVNYNNINYTKNLILDLSKQINKSFTVLVVDQNSTELNTKDILFDLQEKFSFIKLHFNESNVDLNRVWDWFYEKSSSEFLCFLNNDITLTNNFVDDTLKTFENPIVGISIHVTNNDKYIKAENKLNYIILDPPLYQGWDFTIRKNLYKKIPQSLRIFGGDDITFVNVVNAGYKVALIFSSPIIHYKEQTRKIVPEINQIHKLDSENFWKELKIKGLKNVESTMNSYCRKYPLPNLKLTQNKNCVFTALIGNYYDKILLPKVINSNWDYILFTDNKDLKSDFWRIIYIDNPKHMEDIDNLLANFKLARKIKTNYHEWLSSYENLIWKDSRIEINCDLNEYLSLLENNDILFVNHPVSTSILQEMTGVGKLEKQEVINKIKIKYESEGYKYDNGLFSTGILLFKNNENMIKFFSDWWNEINSFSHRDQLSVNYVLWKNKDIKYKTLNYNDVLSIGDNKLFKLHNRTTKRFLF